MRKQDSIEIKIIRTALPLLIYYGVQLLVMCGFGIYAITVEFFKVKSGDGSANYRLAATFLERADSYINSHSLVAGFLASVLTIVILLRLFRRDTLERGERFTKPGKFSRTRLLLCIFMGVTASAGLSKLIPLFVPDSLSGSYEDTLTTVMSNPWLFQFLTLCIVSPVAEELIFRGLMYRRLEEYTDSETAILISALVFGCYHGNLTQGLYAALLGILLCVVYERSKMLRAPAIVHMAANTMALMMMYVPVSIWIDGHLPVKILIMIVELLALVFCVYCFYLNTKTRNNEKGNEK